MQEKKIDYYEKFRNSSLDASAVGLISDPEFRRYGVTPPGARVFAWGEVLGAHFCQRPDEQAVCAVIPDGPDGSPLVYTVAEDLPSFLGLVIACRHTALLLRCAETTRAEFEAALRDTKPTMKQRSVLRALENIYHPPRITDPYGYMQSQKEKHTHAL